MSFVNQLEEAVQSEVAAAALDSTAANPAGCLVDEDWWGAGQEEFRATEHWWEADPVECRAGAGLSVAGREVSAVAAVPDGV